MDRYIAQKSRPSSKVKVKRQRSKVKVPRDKKRKNCSVIPIDNA